MTTASNTDTRSQLRQKVPFGFTSRTVLWFLGLSVVYCLYALRGLLDLHDSFPLLTSLAMMLGPTSIALSLLVSAAVFAAATGRFVPLGRRSRTWVSVALFGLGALFLSTLGPRSAKYLVAVLTTQVAETPAQPLPGSAIPLAIAILVIVSGAAGSAVGRMTQGSSTRSRRIWSWVASLGLLVSFVIPLVVASEAVVQGASTFWILVGPLMIPVLATCFLVCRTRDQQPCLRLSDRFTTAVDSETLDRMVSAVIEADRTEEELDADGLVETESERQMLTLVTALRRESAAVAISESRAQEIVSHMLATPPHIRAPNRTFGLRVDPGTVGQFCSSWICLAVGLVVVGILGGVPPQITAAVSVGLLGTTAIMLLPRWIPHHSNPISK